MSKQRIFLESVTDIKIRNDGKEIRITFVGNNNQSATVTGSLIKMDYLFQELAKVSAAVRAGRILATDKPPDEPYKFSPMTPTYLALDSEFVLAGGLDLRVKTEDGNVQLSLLPQHVQALRELLCS